MRIPIPFPRLAFIDGKGRTPDWSFRVVLIPVKFHKNTLAGEDITGEKLPYGAIERTNFSAIQFNRITVGQ